MSDMHYRMISFLYVRNIGGELTKGKDTHIIIF